MNIDEYYELQEKTLKENTESYKIKDGIKYINIVESNDLYTNAISIINILVEDFEGITKGFSYIKYSSLEKMIVRLLNNCEYIRVDEKIKNWLIRNHRKNYFDDNIRQINKMIRENYNFYLFNKHDVYYR